LPNYTLGPPLKTYGPNIKVTAILGVVGPIPCLLAFGVAMEVRDPIAWAIFYGLTALYGGMFWRQLSSRVSLHQTGISCRGVLSQKEMRWLDIDRVYFGSYEVHAHYIPLGKFYRLKLVSTHGQKDSLGERVRHADELAEEIKRLTFPRLMERARQSFEHGQAVDFDAILVSRLEGLTVRHWYSDVKIAWQEIEGYDGNEAYFKIHRYKKRFAVSVSSDRIANAHVLRAILDGMMQQVWQRGESRGEKRADR
jgi:hypothetical protein